MRQIYSLLAVSFLSFGIAQAAPPNWSGDYSPCERHADLLTRDHEDLSVKFSTSNKALARQFARAMDFWAGVLDLDWHETGSEDCSIQLVDGESKLFDPVSIAARSQYPDRIDFEGWIAFNPNLKLTDAQMFTVSVHEIGHLLGLPHSLNASSVMYYLSIDGAMCLDAEDLDALSSRHKLRSRISASIQVPSS